ncbi:MAG: hypothetical protein C0391_00945 [Anaerolinea sp.]|nr:hypothetical protein [Anaerolinea sp.]
MKLINITHPGMEVNLHRCDTFFSKFRGLMLKRHLAEDEGIVLVCTPPGIVNTSIHMFFMRFDIAVVWLDASFKVVDKTLAKKWRPYYASARSAMYILELHPARISDYNLDDQVQLTDA